LLGDKHTNSSRTTLCEKRETISNFPAAHCAYRHTRGVHTYPLSSDEIVRNIRSDKELGHDTA